MPYSYREIQKLIFQINKQLNKLDFLKTNFQEVIDFFKDNKFLSYDINFKDIIKYRQQKTNSIKNEIIECLNNNDLKKSDKLFLTINSDKENSQEIIWYKTEKEKYFKKNDFLKKIEITVKNNLFKEADDLFLKNDILSQEEYENIKCQHIKKDLFELSKKIQVPIFDDEKANVLASVGQNILVQARAGSGKTTAIALKVRQLIRFYGIKAEEILVLAFNKQATNEFCRRINKYCQSDLVDNTNCLTFHSLAYRLVNPNKKLLFNDGKDKSEFVKGQQSEFIGKIYNQILAEDRGTILTLIYNFFRSLAKEKMFDDFDNEGNYYLYRRNLRHISLAGERVKSKGEKFVADFLFEHKLFIKQKEVEYKYEWNLPGGKRGYKPDFSFWELDRVKSAAPLAIVEHFGVTKEHPADRNYMSVEDEKKYAQEIEWKKNYCVQNAIIFLSTSANDLDRSGEKSERVNFEKILKTRLESSGFVLEKLKKNEIYEKMLNSKANLDQLFDQITQFINRAKKQTLTPYDIQQLAKKESYKLSNRSIHFVKIARRIYERYQESLNKEEKIDFDDLLASATKKIIDTRGCCEIEILGKAKQINSIKYILIDEYQDFSKLFYQLISAIKQFNPGISFFFVGDDWQAINGFAGSDLDYFSNFQQYFIDGHRVSLLTNYRSFSNIILHSNLLMSNRGIGGKPAINQPSGSIYCSRLLYVESRDLEECKERYQNDEEFRVASRSLRGWQNKQIEISQYLKTIKYIVEENDDKKICLLSRTHEIYGVKISSFVDQIRKWRYPDKWDVEKDNNGKENSGYVNGISFSTAHSFKGKESDIIIIIGVNKGSFPMIHPDNELMEILGVTVPKVIEEERRLFYVAVTRAKEKLYMLYENDLGVSDFVLKDWKYLDIKTKDE